MARRSECSGTTGMVSGLCGSRKDYLDDCPRSFLLSRWKHAVGCNHQDWLAAHQPKALAEEWRLILANSGPGTCILMRSASPQINFIPEFARRRLLLNPHMAETLHSQDRVGTYGCTLLAHIIP